LVTYKGEGKNFLDGERVCFLPVRKVRFHNTFLCEKGVARGDNREGREPTLIQKVEKIGKLKTWGEFVTFPEKRICVLCDEKLRRGQASHRTQCLILVSLY